MAKKSTGDAGAAAQAAYETSEAANKPGRYPAPVDLNALTFSESRRTPVDGDDSRPEGKFRPTRSQIPSTGKSNPDNGKQYNNRAGAK